ncbi:MAG: proton-conducting transporter transmembrane domain-containing protein [Solirubrobacteraceae bacterium]
MNAVFAVAYCLLAAGVLLPLASARIAAISAAIGCALLAVVGFATAAATAHVVVGIGSWLGFGPAALISDRLAGIFLALTGVTGAAVSLALIGRPPARLVASLHALILFAVAVVIGTDQAFLFLLAWETITLSLYLLGSADRDRPGALVAGYFGGAVSKLGGAALLGAFGLMYARTGSFELSAWLQAGHQLGTTRDVVFVLLLIGFGTKIGVVPFQGPLPPLYAAAPGASAATISIAFNAAFYGLWRLVYQVLAPAPIWWGELLIVLGAAGAFVGILYAIAQDEIKRFLGFSSVEHAGIVLLGFGVALVGQSVHEPKLAGAGLLAATLHLIMHGVAKTLAFLGADRVIAQTGEENLLPLGGLAARIPRTAVGFGIAVLTLAAMPPFGGFVSEWFTLEALLQAFRLQSTVAQLVLALGAAMLALTAGIGLLAFAKLYGGAFLGRARSTITVVRGTASSTIPFLALAAVTAGLGAIAPWEIRWLGHGLEDLLGFDLAKTTISHPLVLGPVFPGFSVLAPTWLAVGIPAFMLAAALGVRVLLRPSVRRAPIWVSGAAVDPALFQYTPESYSNPIRVVLAGAYGFKRSVVATPDEATGAPRSVRTRVVPAFEHYLYRPLIAAVLRLSTRARRFQSGKLGFYLLYVLIVLLAVLALIPALKD